VSALLTAIAAYLIGGFATGVLVSRYLLGRDVRDFGSGNPGAVNVWRVFGLRWGLMVVAVDVGKGYLAVALLPMFAGANVWDGYPSFLGLLAVAGHIWSPFTGFRGGKGVGTVAGVALALYPYAAALAVTIWCLVALATKYSSVASLTAGWIFPLLVLSTNHVSNADLITVFLVPVILTWTHRDNLHRLRVGKELKIGRSEPLAE